MNKTYNINLECISLFDFQEMIRERNLIPSRKILKEELDRNFQILTKAGISNLQELVKTLNTASRISVFSKATSLSEEYLKILKREASSFTSNPINLRNFPDIDPTILNKLEDHGIKNTKHLFDITQNNSQFIEKLYLSEDMTIKLNELISLSELVRLYGVGPVFAKIIFKVGIKSIHDFVKYTGEEFVEIYEKETKKKADFSIHDINFSLELARKMF